MEDLRARDPAVIATIARGSSDHAATYLKYAVELVAGIPVASVGPSIASIYGRPLRLPRGACIGISQSGRSPDIVEMVQTATAGGALSIAITNHADSPMAAASAHCLPLAAGEEKSVAATKTFVNSVLAGLSLLAEWQRDRALQDAIAASPQALARAVALGHDVAEGRVDLGELNRRSLAWRRVRKDSSPRSVTPDLFRSPPGRGGRV